MILTDLETRNQFSNFDNIPKELRVPISLYIWFNNSKVALYAFVLGVTLGLGTIFILTMNGLMLGTLMSIYFMNGHLPLFFAMGRFDRRPGNNFKAQDLNTFHNCDCKYHCYYSLFYTGFFYQEERY